MRTFQYSDAKPHEFWNIEVRGEGFTITYGKVGAAGQTQTRTFAIAAEAEAEADKLIEEKLKKGYIETTRKAAASQAEGFERALAADPSDLAGWCAYADYLAEGGDPRGEFMQVQIALENESLSRAERDALKKEEAKLLTKHQRDWLGPLAAFTLDAEPVQFWDADKEGERMPVTHQFARGWLSRLEFHHLTVGHARALAAAPQARLLRELVVEGAESEAPAGSTHQYIDSYYEPGPDVPADIEPYDKPGLHALCRCPHLGSVRVFRLGEGVERPDWNQGQEHKFWTIDVRGNGFTVTYGKVGTPGQSQTKTFSSPEQARATADRLIRGKLAKRYIETTPPVPTAQAVAFEQALAEDPDDLAGWSAYADYLTEQGSPRGEFMQVQLALEDESLPAAERKKLRARERELLEKHEREWLGSLAPALLEGDASQGIDVCDPFSDPATEHRWRRGFLGL